MYILLQSSIREYCSAGWRLHSMVSPSHPAPQTLGWYLADDHEPGTGYLSL